MIGLKVEQMMNEGDREERESTRFEKGETRVYTVLYIYYCVNDIFGTVRIKFNLNQKILVYRDQLSTTWRVKKKGYSYA